MKWRKPVISVLILSIAMAFYDIFFKGYWYGYVEGQGRSVGVGEVAGGYFLVGMFVLVVNYLLTRKIGAD